MEFFGEEILRTESYDAEIEVKNKIIDIFNKKITKHGLNVKLKVLFKRDSVATYVRETNTIEVGIVNMMNHHKGLKSYLKFLENKYTFPSIDEFIDIILSHELGHFVDKSVNEILDEQKEIAEKINQVKSRNELIELFKQVFKNQITLESNAWNFSLDFTDFKEKVTVIKNVSLENDRNILYRFKDILLDKFDEGRPLNFRIE